MIAPQKTWEIVAPDEFATQELARDLASAIASGDVIAIGGELGSGKTALARAVIRALAEDEHLEVPSPTFTLMQVYELPRFAVVHADLYRVNTLAELSELGWEEASAGAAVLVEWPEKAGPLLQAERLEIHIELAPDLGPGSRRISLTGIGIWAEKLTRLRAEHTLLEASGFGEARRLHIQGDASTRSYERLVFDEGEPAILMKAPAGKDGPPIRQGKTYGEIAKLAQNMEPFVALSRGLRARGFSAPEIYAADLNNGLLLIEDLGTEGIVEGNPPEAIEERYAVAVELLATLHGMDLPGSLPVAPRIEYAIPRYDLDAFLIEAELLLDWYLPHRGAKPVGAVEREVFRAMWRDTLIEPLSHPPTWVLRDFHSPNLLWLEAREGIEKIGLLDFQDALIGPAAYDVASVLMDARCTVSQETEVRLLSRYAIARLTADPSFDHAKFAAHYVAMGAQRATKILGIFARLNKRDGKPQYLGHMPRVWGYLMRALEHPTLSAIKGWYEANVPPPEAKSSAPGRTAP
ncbi:MAG: tRNA (adenosine(37)-N6)-threonylcarbamoyltransferase complex ATPase subunit type 1 TsaE [Rhizobiales bacterium]|nr:tRNA (adenosine(37)-N6)-threonylcarbamoyltransferase complex ATPase subunit type 1 TsaE [Hyphomicrobiales bacterium]